MKQLAHSICSVAQGIISSFDKHLLSVSSVSGSVLGAGDTERKEFEKGDRQTKNETEAWPARDIL